MKKMNVIWRDRRRYFGLPISFTRYAMDTQRLYLISGFWKTVTQEMLLYRILDISSCQTFTQKIFGVGDVTLHTTDKSNPVFVLKDIKNSDEVRKMISTIAEDQRESKQIRGREMYMTKSHDIDMQADADNDGIPDYLENQ